MISKIPGVKQSLPFGDAERSAVSDSPRWGMPNVLITPHVAILGTPYRQKWKPFCSKTAGGSPRVSR